MSCNQGTTLFLSLLLVSGVGANPTCAPYPIAVSVGNTTLVNGQIARGVQLSVGTPSQSMAFLPLWPLNNIFVYGTNDFRDSVSQGWSDDGCTTFRGGRYDPGTSSTQQGGAASAFASDEDTTQTYPTLTKTSDTIQLNKNVTLAKFPLGVVEGDWGEQGYYPQAAIGLEPNSTLLATLYASGTIASRSWSWFWGLNGDDPTTQMDGSLVLGGYDKAKVSGEGYKQTVSTDSGQCATGMLVTLTDVSIGFLNGPSASLFPTSSSAALAACLDPSYPSLMTISLDPYFAEFALLTGVAISDRSKGLNFYDMQYSVGDTPFDGEITLSFSSGLTVTVPNAQYIGADVTIDQDTGTLEANSSAPSIAIDALQSTNSGDMLHIGRHFFSAAYVSASYDTGIFTMWPAKVTTTTNLVALDSDGNEVDTFCLTSEHGTSTVTAAAGTDAPTATADSKTTGSPVRASTTPRNPVGAIAGGVVGGVAALALLGLAVCLRRRRKATSKISHDLAASPAYQRRENHELGTGPNRSSLSKFPLGTPHELAPSQADCEVPIVEAPKELYVDHPPQELSGHSNLRFELA